MAIKAYVSKDMPIIANAASDSPHTAQIPPTVTIPTSRTWDEVSDKPFNTVDSETLSTEGGVLRFKTASYENLSDLPSIEGVKLVDDKTFEELGMEECSILDIEKMFT